MREAIEAIEMTPIRLAPGEPAFHLQIGAVCWTARASRLRAPQGGRGPRSELAPSDPGVIVAAAELGVEAAQEAAPALRLPAAYAA
jgi:hypothetical protein